MIRLILTAAVVGGLLHYVFGQEARPPRQAVKSSRKRKPAHRPARRVAA